MTLDAGANGLFQSTCKTSTGTASATLTDQNHDRTDTVPDAFTVSGCPASGAGAGSAPVLTQPGVAGLRSGRPSLSFTLTVPRGAAKLRSFTVELPAGLSFAGRRSGGRTTVRGVTVSGGQIKSLGLSHGHLVVTLRSAVSRVRVKLGNAALRENASSGPGPSGSSACA